MRVKTKVPHIWEEVQSIREKFPSINFLPEIVGEQFHIYGSKKGRIVLVDLLKFPGDKRTFWKIRCLEGDLFKGTRKFSYKKLALIKIMEYLK